MCVEQFKKSNRFVNSGLYLIIVSIIIFSSCNVLKKNNKVEKRTVCILGGTPSTKEILQLIPDSLKNLYHFISFNRPGFGETDPSEVTDEMIIRLAKNAGLRENDFGVIGVSGGAPFAILLASALKLKHCGIISGMVSNRAYFKYADSTFTKGVMKGALNSYESFRNMALKFPNVDDIVLQAGDSSKDAAILACYNELHFILSEGLANTLNNKSIPIDWWHGENDKNVSIHSVELFLSSYKYATLNKIQEASHDIDSRIYIEKILNGWAK